VHPSFVYHLFGLQQAWEVKVACVDHALGQHVARVTPRSLDLLFGWDLPEFQPLLHSWMQQRLELARSTLLSQQ